MSERLTKALETSRSEIQRGLVETEKELAELRGDCRELEELVALAKATLFATQMSGSFPPAGAAASAQTPPQAAVPVPGAPHLHRRRLGVRPRPTMKLGSESTRYLDRSTAAAVASGSD